MNRKIYKQINLYNIRSYKELHYIKMGAMSKRESANKRTIDFHNRMKKRAKDGKLIPPSDEKGKYYVWRHDLSNGIQFDKNKKKEFLRLEKKYGK